MTKIEEIKKYCGIIADANAEIGTGHIMRTLILARKLKAKNVLVEYIVSNTPSKFCDWIKEQGFSVIEVSREERDDPTYLIQFLGERVAYKKMLLFDSDHPRFYEKNYQNELKFSGIGLAMITFKHEPLFNIDILHNQNPLALTLPYQTSEVTKRLFGLENLIAKDEYQTLYRKSHSKEISEIKTILLTFGGADSKGLTLRMINSLIQLPSMFFFTINVVVGALNKDLAEITNLVASKRHDFRLYNNTPEMPQLMYESDLSINSGGLTVWELACCKTLNFVIPTSEREIKTAEKLKADQLIYFDSIFDEMTDERIQNKLLNILDNSDHYSEMIDTFHNKVNPNGADNFILAIENWFQKN